MKSCSTRTGKRVGASMSLDDSAVLLGSNEISSLDETVGRPAFFRSSMDIFVPGEAPGGAGAAARPAARDNMLGRVFDILFAAAVLIAVAPALVLLIIALRMDSPGSVFFVQRRVGRNGELFPCIKLRTM